MDIFTVLNKDGYTYINGKRVLKKESEADIVRENRRKITKLDKVREGERERERERKRERKRIKKETERYDRLKKRKERKE